MEGRCHASWNCEHYGTDLLVLQQAGVDQLRVRAIDRREELADDNDRWRERLTSGPGTPSDRWPIAVEMSTTAASTAACKLAWCGRRTGIRKKSSVALCKGGSLGFRGNPGLDTDGGSQGRPSVSYDRRLSRWPANL
jgi:hypothetical protein